MLSGCFPAKETIIPTPSETQQFSPTTNTPSLTPEFQPSQTVTPTPPATLRPEQTDEMLRQLLREPKDCLAPCFWGIIPEKTTLNELENIIKHLGLPFDSTQNNGWDFYGTIYKFRNGISLLVTLPVKEEVVKSISVDINLQGYKPSGPTREWESYSPETLIKQYGSPSSVEFSGSSGEHPLYHMTIRFDSIHTIVEYSYGETNQSFHVCPLSDKFGEARLWFGENPLDPPYDGIPLEQATTMTMSDFSDLLLGNPEGACFSLNSQVFQ